MRFKYKRYKKSAKTSLLIVYRSLAIGGIEKKLVGLINNLDSERFTIRLALFNKEGALLKKLPKRVKVYSLEKKGVGGIFKAVNNLRKLIDSKYPSVVLTYGDYPSAFTLASRFIWHQKPKIIVGVGNVMSHWVNFQKFGLLRRLAIKFYYPKANRLIAVSKEVRKDLIGTFNIPKDKISVIYNSPYLFGGVLEKDRTRKIVPKKPVILYAGRLVKQKRVDLLISAFSKLVRKINAKLLIIGDGPEKDRLITLTRRFGIEKNVYFEDFTLKIEEKITTSTVVVLVSAVEGCPNLVLESMKCGTPVVVSNYTGAEELIKDGVNGFLVPLDITSGILSDRIANVLDNPKKLLQVSTKARKFSEAYSIKKQILKYEKAFLD